jgi:N-acetylglucosaminyl-diphospho-decaprenol L-rhamnosyltransferase
MAGDLAVVIVSYNVRDLLADSLASVLAEIHAFTVEVFVVDNASADGSAQLVRERFPTVRLVANSENRGFAAANNQALRAAGFPAGADAPRFALLLNPDTTLEPGALSAWLEGAAECPRAGVLGPSLRYPDGTFQHSGFGFPTLAQVFLEFYSDGLPARGRLLDSRLNGRYPRRRYMAGRPFPVDHPLGAAMLARRDAIAGVGLLDEGYFIYAEEVDWCLRMRKAGWGAACVPQAKVVHHEGQSTRQFRQAMFVALWRSRLRLFARHYSPAFNWAARRLIGLGLRRLEVDPERRTAVFQVRELLRQPPEAFL